jgi:RNA-directed DNA polymerase
VDKIGSSEKRGLGIPTMRDRAAQALVLLALEPEWEAQFEPNSYGFRPGRSTHDAIEAIFKFIYRLPKYVLDTDIEKCFDRINHTALLTKLKTIRPIARVIRAWLKAGILEDGKYLYPEEGAPQGSVISPLLCNIALHGLEQALVNAFPKQYKIAVVRFADDLVVLCTDLQVLKQLKNLADDWLAQMGLRLKPAKTRFTHTLDPLDGNVGFDFLGFNVRQYRVGRYKVRRYTHKPGYKTLIKPSKLAVKRHLHKVHQIIRQYRGAPQVALIKALNPVIRGWARYYSTCVAKVVFSWMDHQVYCKLYRWVSHCHPKKRNGWRIKRYWHNQEGRSNFGNSEIGWLAKYRDMPIRRHIKVRGSKSPYDSDWVYWGGRLGRDPTKPRRMIRMLKRQNGKCFFCGHILIDGDTIETHHLDGNTTNNRYANLTLMHAHCHNQWHGNRDVPTYGKRTMISVSA